jgi:hypothetical protein
MIPFFMPKGIHGFHGFRFPIGDDLVGIGVETEMFADIEVKVVFIPLVTEEGIATAKDVWIDDGRKLKS